jgi:hypothetical protein
MPDPVSILRALLLLGTANGAPVLATKLSGGSFAVPLDAGIRLPDGRPLFGAAKTVRGLLASIIATTAMSALLGLGWAAGAGVAAAAMGGDLISSFVKRRLGLALHARATGLDQVPEALLPMLLFRSSLGLSAADIAVALAAFIVLEIILSRLLFSLHIRDRPY